MTYDRSIHAGAGCAKDRKLGQRLWLTVDIGTRIEESGTLIRETDGVVFRRDLGGRWRLDLYRVGIDLAEQYTGQRVTITGTVVAKGLIDIDALAPEA